MKTTHEKLITSLLALGLVGVSPAGAQSFNSFNSGFGVNDGLLVTVAVNEDLNSDGNLDMFADTDIDTDGRFDFIDERSVDETQFNETNYGGLGVDVDVNGDGVITNGLIDFDINGDGLIQVTAYAQDLDGDGFQDLGNEIDLDRDGIIDVGGEDDVGFDGRLTLGEDTDNDGFLDIDENALAGTDQDSILDSNSPNSARNSEVDQDADGNFDFIDERNVVETQFNETNYGGLGVDVDVNGDGQITNGLIDFDINGDGVIQVAAYAQDLDGDGFEDLGNEIDIDGNGLFAVTEDLDGDGNFDRTLENDVDSDGRFDIHNEGAIDETAIVETDFGGLGVDVDVNGNGVIDAVAYNFDINNDGVIAVVNYAEDLDNDGVVDGGTEFDLDRDGRFDLGLEDLDGDGFFDAIDEDVDGDDQLDRFAEDLNRNGTLDTESRTYLTAVNPLTDAVQDLDVIVADALYVNGERVLVQSNNLEAGEIGIEGVITRKANGDIHIGENSLITNEFTDANGVITQQLFARDAGNNAIDIDITNGSDLLIGGVSVATDADVALARGDLTAAFTAADNNLQNQIDINANRIANNRRDIESNTRGIAMVAALQHTTVLPGMTQALDISAAHFEGETGLAINYSRRINENVQINFGAATTSDGDESVIKGGIGWQW